MNLVRVACTAVVVAAGISLFGCGMDTDSGRVGSVDDQGGHIGVRAIDKSGADNIASDVAPNPDTVAFNAAKAFAEDPDHNTTEKGGGNPWDMRCAALMFQFCVTPSAARAIDAYNDLKNKGKIAGTNPSDAPMGAFHYFEYNADGHVGVDLNGGGQKVFMGSGFLQERWNKNRDLGWNSVAGYEKASGGKYLGWSMEFGSNDHGFAICDPLRKR